MPTRPTTDKQQAARNRISRFTYDPNSTANTRTSEKILLTTDAKDSEIHSAGWIGFKPSAYGAGVSHSGGDTTIYNRGLHDAGKEGMSRFVPAPCFPRTWAVGTC